MGATGRTLAQLLLDRGLFVRAFVRTDDERAAKLRAAGAEVHEAQHLMTLILICQWAYFP